MQLGVEHWASACAEGVQAAGVRWWLLEQLR